MLFFGMRAASDNRGEILTVETTTTPDLFSTHLRRRLFSVISHSSHNIENQCSSARRFLISSTRFSIESNRACTARS
jgi:hypothetical protein